MNTYTFEVYSLSEKEVTYKQIEYIKVKTSDGEISIYANHMPLITDVLPGEIEIKTNGKKDKFNQSGGILVTEKLLCKFFKTPTPKVTEQKEHIQSEDIRQELFSEFSANLSSKQRVKSV